MKDTGKLSKGQKMYIIQAFAEFESCSAIKAILKSRFRKNVSVQNIWGYQARYKDEIKEIRDKYIENIGEVGVAHKRVRLEYRQRMINQILTVGDPRLFGVAARLLDGCASEFDKYMNPADQDLINERLREIAEALSTYDSGPSDPDHKDN